EADATHASRFQLGNGERLARNADHEIERLRDRGAHRLHRREVRQARRHQHVRARLLVGLQALDRVIKIGVAAPEAFGARGEHERKSEACRCHGSGDALGRLADVEQRLVLSAFGRGRLDPPPADGYTSVPGACACATATRGAVAGSGETGRWVASTMARACASAWSQVIVRSRVPYAQADAPREVASAAKPRPARTRADPASQTLAMTNARVP